MNEKIDAVIHKLDALMNGAQPGDTEPPPFVPPVLDAMRAVVRELVVDCRTCTQFFEGHCARRGECINGDRYVAAPYVPMWEMRKTKL